jgi:molybdopterin-guanine dinucleotide biosynthesis protein A
MGGADKALVPVAGKPLLAHVLARLEPQVSRIVLSANGDPARFAEFGLPVVADAEPDQGPLAGIVAGAEACQWLWPTVTHMMTVPVDVPLLPGDLLTTMTAKGLTLRPLAARAGGRTHWTIGLWPLSAALALAPHVSQKGLRRLEDAFGLYGGETVDFANAEAFMNINSIEDAKNIERLLGEN